VTLPDWVSLRARTDPEVVAIETPDATLTYAALELSVGAAAGALRASGVSPGDRVAILGEPSAAFAVAVHAVTRAGAALVPLNTRLTAAELAWQLEASEATLLLADRPAVASAPVQLALDASLWSGKERVEAPAPPAGFDDDEPFCLIFSSGTTGRPKAIVLTHGNVYWSAVGSAENLGVAPEDRWLACMPLFHVGGLSIIARSVIYGTTAVIQPQFDPSAVARALHEERISLLSVVPTMLRRLLELTALEAPALRAVLVGGGAASPALLARARERGLPVLATFGLSEAASQVTTQRLRRSPAMGSSGTSMTPTTLRVDIDGRRALPNEVGDLLVRGPTVMAGYSELATGRETDTRDALRQGWLHTGDSGFLDGAGELHVVDRRDDLIVTGGENVYPAEVEQALEAHPAVKECAVVGLPDADLGQRVAAIIVPAARAPSTNELDAHVRSTLAGYKVPRHYEFRDEPLPRNVLGKLQRRALGDEVKASLES
jgi:O-succinylbenzoic acid--CoA ligase